MFNIIDYNNHHFQFFSVRWFRGSKDRCSIDIEAGMAPEFTANFMRKGSLNLQARARATEGIGRSLQRARRRVERRLGRFGIGKGKKKVGGTEEVSGSCKYYLIIPHANLLIIILSFLHFQVSVDAAPLTWEKVPVNPKWLYSKNAD